MQKLANLIDRELTWSQPSMRKKEFELHAGELLAATLRFRSSFGSLAIAESGDGCWTFKRNGFFKTHVSVRRCDDDTRDIATFHNNTWSGGGSMEISGGPTLRASTNLWRTKYSFNSPSEEPLVVFNTHGLVRYSADVEIRPQAAQMLELPLMVMLGWYLAVMMKNDDAASASAAAAAAG